MTSEELKQIHFDYLASGDVVDLPPVGPFQERNGNPNMFGSEIGFCPARTAYRRLAFDETHPELNKSYEKLQLFKSGNLLALQWKEAMCWKYGLGARPEMEVETLGMIGHVDVAIIDDSRWVPLEIKNTSFTSLQPNHILQCQFYMMALDSVQGYVIYQRRHENQIFSIGRDDDSVRELIEGQESALKFIAEGDEWTPRIEDEPPYWCSEEDGKHRQPRPAERKSKNYGVGEIRPGDITVSCPFFGHCYKGKDKYVYQTFLDDKTGDLIWR